MFIICPLSCKRIVGELHEIKYGIKLLVVLKAKELLIELSVAVEIPVLLILMNAISNQLSRLVFSLLVPTFDIKVYLCGTVIM